MPVLVVMRIANRVEISFIHFIKFICARCIFAPPGAARSQQAFYLFVGYIRRGRDGQPSQYKHKKLNLVEPSVSLAFVPFVLFVRRAKPSNAYLF